MNLQPIGHVPRLCNRGSVERATERLQEIATERLSWYRRTMRTVDGARQPVKMSLRSALPVPSPLVEDTGALCASPRLRDPTAWRHVAIRDAESVAACHRDTAAQSGPWGEQQVDTSDDLFGSQIETPSDHVATAYRRYPACVDAFNTSPKRSPIGTALHSVHEASRQDWPQSPSGDPTPPHTRSAVRRMPSGSSRQSLAAIPHHLGNSVLHRSL